MITTDGSWIREGSFVNGKLQGFGRQISTRGYYIGEFKDYLRHQSDITTSLRELLSHISEVFSNEQMYVNFTGSASLLLAENIGIQFTQEVIRLGKVAYINKVIIRHEHYGEKGNSNTGDVDFAAQKTLHYAGRDGQVFRSREERGFPREGQESTLRHRCNIQHLLFGCILFHTRPIAINFCLHLFNQILIFRPEEMRKTPLFL